MSFLDLVGPITSTAEEVEASLRSDMQSLAGRIGKYNLNTEDFSECVIAAACQLSAPVREEMAKQALDQLDKFASAYATAQAQLRQATNFRDAAQEKYDEAMSKFNAAQGALNAAQGAGPDCDAFNDLVGFGRSALKSLTTAADKAFGVVDKYQKEVDKATGLLNNIQAAFNLARKTANTLLFAPCE